MSADHSHRKFAMSLMRYFAVKGVSDLPAPIVIFSSVGLIEWFIGYNYGWLSVIISLGVAYFIVKSFTNVLKSAGTMADYDYKRLEELVKKDIAESSNPAGVDVHKEAELQKEAERRREANKMQEESLRRSMMSHPATAKIQAQWDKEDADKRAADEQRREEILDSLVPVDPFPNPIREKAEKLEEL